MKLSKEEATSLTQEIKKDINSLGHKLLKAYEGDAHEALGYSTWREYAVTEFNIDNSRAYQLLTHVRILATLSDEGDHSPGSTIVEHKESPMPTEGQARELAPLRNRPSVMRQVWNEAVKRSPQKPPTAALIKETREDYLARVTRYVNGYLQNMEYVIDALTTLNNHEIEDKLIPLIRDAHFKYLEVSSKIIGPNEASSLRRIK